MPKPTPSEAPAAPGAPTLLGAIARIATRRPLLVLAVMLALVGLAAERIAHLRLATDFAELLPEHDPAVVTLREMDRRMASLSSLHVVVQGPDREANRAAAEAIAARLRTSGDPLIHDMVDDVVTGVQEERAFAAKNKFLYPSVAELEDTRDKVRATIAKKKNPLLGALDLEDDSDDSLATAEHALERADATFSHFPGGYFAYADGTLFAVVVWLKSGFLDQGPGTATAARIRTIAREVIAAHPSPGQTVGLTGNIITAAEERAALANDLTWATGICVVLVCLVVLLFFGRPSAVLFMVAPAIVGTLLALAFAQLAFGALNTATGFMGSILLGNGINYAIIQMARYEEERRAGRNVHEAIVIALAGTWRATGVAALGAAIAYGSLALTDFRGFNQFGYIGGVGMILSWIATLVVLPALWALLDRRPTTKVAGTSWRGFSLAAAPLGTFARRHPRAILGAGLALSVLSALPLARYLRDPFEYDFGKLRNQAARHAEAEVLSSRLDPIFGRSMSPGFVLADQPEQAPAIKRALLAADPRHEVLGDARTVFDFLPGTIAEQQRKLVVLGELRDLLDNNLALAADEDRARLAKLRPPDGLAPLAPRDLPRAVRRYYTEIDGTIGRVVAWFPKDEVNIWDGRVQRRLAEIVREVRLPDGARVRSSGAAVIFAGMLDAIVRDGPRVTALSFAGVLLLVFALAPRRGVPLIAGTLALGVLWMAGGVAGADVRLNFLNFVAFPITFGIGVDYGANLYLRYRLEGHGGVERAVTATGGAVALCSLTTIIGYGTLLTADTSGLKTFGAAAMLGEIACLTAALLVLPATLVLLEARAGASRDAKIRDAREVA